jgi:hypothetical protein
MNKIRNFITCEKTKLGFHCNITADAVQESNPQASNEHCHFSDTSSISHYMTSEVIQLDDET